MKKDELHSSSKQKIAIYFLHGFLGHPSDGDILQQNVRKNLIESKSGSSGIGAIKAIFGRIFSKDWKSGHSLRTDLISMAENNKFYQSEIPAHLFETIELQWHNVDYMNSNRLNSKNDLFTWGQNFVEAVQAMSTDPNQLNVLVGYSLGGRLAQQAFQNRPDLFSHLICLSSHVGLSSEAEKSERYKNDQKWAFRFLREDFAKVLVDWNSQNVFVGNPYPGQSESDFVSRAKQRAKAEPKRRAEDYNKSLLADALLRWSLAKQDFSSIFFQQHCGKIYWIVGQNDLRYVQLSQRLLENELVTGAFQVPNSAHRVLFEDPEYCGDLIARILMSQLQN